MTAYDLPTQELLRALERGGAVSIDLFDLTRRAGADSGDFGSVVFRFDEGAFRISPAPFAADDPDEDERGDALPSLFVEPLEGGLSAEDEEKRFRTLSFAAGELTLDAARQGEPGRLFALRLLRADGAYLFLFASEYDVIVTRSEENLL